jgi:hypothetical protein
MMRFLTLLLLVTTSLIAQTPAPATTGSVSGRVLDADTQLPVAAVKVGSQKLGWTLTDSDGRYTIRGLAPGSVSIGIQGDREMMETVPVVPRTVNVAGGRDLPGIDFRVRIDAYISGHVFDANGDPVSGIKVTVFHREYPYRSAGEGAFTSSDQLLNAFPVAGPNAGTITDDRGVYSFSVPVLAGRSYRVYAERERTASSAVSDAPAEVQARQKVLSPTYYPNARSLETATPVLLHSHERRDNLDIHMSSGPSYCIDGTAKAAGPLPSPLQVVIEEEATAAMHSSTNVPRRGAAIGEDGRIRICGLHAGLFQLTVIGPGAPNIPQYFATVPVSIGDADVHGIMLTATPPVTISGEVSWDGAPGSDGPFPAVRINATPRFGPYLAGRAPDSAEFSFQVVDQLFNAFEITGLKSRQYVKDITRDGVSVRDKAFLPGNGGGTVRVIIGRDAGSITAQTTPGATVLVLSATAQSDVELLHSMVSGIPDDMGMFVAAGLRPDKYYVLATNNPPSNQVMRERSPIIERTPEALEFLRTARVKGTLVEITPGLQMQVLLVPKD